MFASIQPRTSPNKFVSSSSQEFELELCNLEPLLCSSGHLREAGDVHERGDRGGRLRSGRVGDAGSRHRGHLANRPGWKRPFIHAPEPFSPSFGYVDSTASQSFSKRYAPRTPVVDVVVVVVVVMLPQKANAGAETRSPPASACFHSELSSEGGVPTFGMDGSLNCNVASYRNGH